MSVSFTALPCFCSDMTVLPHHRKCYGEKVVRYIFGGAIARFYDFLYTSMGFRSPHFV